MHRVLLVLLALVALTVLGGCRHAPPASKAAASGEQSVRVVVVGIDVTGSYALRDQVPDLVARLFLQNAGPGDSWYFRVISNESYSDRAEIKLAEGSGRVTLPEVKPLPSNRFNKRARLQHIASQRYFEQKKSEVCDKLRSLRMRPVRGTDIWGFLSKAQDLKATEIVMYTDLGDTRNLRPEQLQLNGARVWVLAFQSGHDPRQALKRRLRWDEALRKAGASQVVFRDVTQAPPEL